MKYGITKVHQTFADALVAVGMAALLRTIPTTDGSVRTVTIDSSAYYTLTTQDITEESLALTPYSKLLEPFFWEGNGEGFDLRARWQDEEKDDLLGNYSTILNLAAATTFNTLVTRWANLSRGEQQQQITILLRLYASPANDIDAAMVSYKPFSKTKPWASSLQIVNPEQGKGISSSKAGQDQVAGGMKEFWLVELLKYVGFMCVAACLGTDDEDIKIQVIAPTHADFDTLCKIARQFRKTPRPTSPLRCDIMSILELALILHDYPDVTVRYLETAYYKKMGSARAVMNISDLGIPAWSRETIADNKRVAYYIKSVNPNNPEDDKEKELLTLFRDALSAQDQASILRFHSTYPEYLMHKREKNGQAMQFAMSTFNEMLFTDK